MWTEKINPWSSGASVLKNISVILMVLSMAICEDDRYQQGELEEKLYAMGKRLGICLEVYVYERGESLLNGN